MCIVSSRGVGRTVGHSLISSSLSNIFFSTAPAHTTASTALTVQESYYLVPTVEDTNSGLLHGLDSRFGRDGDWLRVQYSMSADPSLAACMNFRL